MNEKPDHGIEAGAIQPGDRIFIDTEAEPVKPKQFNEAQFINAAIGSEQLGIGLHNFLLHKKVRSKVQTKDATIAAAEAKRARRAERNLRNAKKATLNEHALKRMEDTNNG
jgi:hypothetical protein